MLCVIVSRLDESAKCGGAWSLELGVLHALFRQSLPCVSRYVRKNHFPGWARPFEFNATLYSSMDRHEEARDGVRSAVQSYVFIRV